MSNQTGAKNKLAVSVIIPAYNASSYLDQCFQSLKSQSMTQFEMIFINDASTDTTSKIISSYSSRDERVRLIEHRTNRGEGASRNSGLDVARGDFIFHLDADDTITENALELLYRNAMAHDSDLVKGSFEKIHSDGTVESQQWEIVAEKVVNTCIAKSLLLQQIPPSHCTYLYRRSFVERYNLRYPEDLRVGLDLVALTQALLRAKTVTILPDVVYQYHQSPDSVTRGRYAPSVPLDAIEARSRATRLLIENGFQQAAERRLRRWSFDINRYWIRHPRELSFKESQAVFNAFRDLMSSVPFEPWHRRTPLQQRYLLSLVLCGEDARALEFLESRELREGITDPVARERAMALVLENAPNDPDTLFQLGRCREKRGDKQAALELFDQALSFDDQHAGAREHAARLRKPPACIMMATYNGATHVSEQIESIQKQTHTNWRLLIADDGSVDNTGEILLRASKSDSRIALLDMPPGSSKGAAQNFSRLMKSGLDTNSNLFFFCDQDDVWAPDKLEKQLAQFPNSGMESIPILVHSDLEVVDDELEQVTPSLFRYMSLEPNPDKPLNYLLSRNFVTGCSMAANRKLLEYAWPVPGQAIMHDWWLAQIAATYGDIRCIDKALAKYRQHSANSIGAKGFWHGLNPANNWAQGWRAGNREFLATIEQAKSLLERVRDISGAPPDKARDIAIYSELLHHGRPSRLALARRLRLRQGNALLQAIFYLRLMTI